MANIWGKKNKSRAFDGGNATVEFVLCFPILLAVLTLTFAVFHAVLQFNRASKAMYTISDLASRDAVINEVLVTQYQTLYQSFIAAPSGAVLRISRLNYVEKAEPGEPPIVSSGFEPPDGFYEVAWSLPSPASADVWCDADITKPCPEATRFTYALATEHLANYALPTIGDGAHIILVDVYAPYAAPLQSGMFGMLPAFNQLEWTMSHFMWPRTPDGLDYKAP